MKNVPLVVLAAGGMGPIATTFTKLPLTSTRQLVILLQSEEDTNCSQHHV